MNKCTCKKHFDGTLNVLSWILFLCHCSSIRRPSRLFTLLWKEGWEGGRGRGGRGGEKREEGKEVKRKEGKERGKEGREVRREFKHIYTHTSDLQILQYRQ